MVFLKASSFPVEASPCWVILWGCHKVLLMDIYLALWELCLSEIYLHKSIINDSAFKNSLKKWRHDFFHGTEFSQIQMLKPAF